MKKIVYVLLILSLLFVGSCFDTPQRVGLRVPHYVQENYNYCAAACIQMWLQYDRMPWATQDEIANFCNITPSGIYPHEIVNGVRAFTQCRQAYLARRDQYWPGALGDIITSANISIDNGEPSIIFFHQGSHAVIATGFKTHYSSLGKLVVDQMYYNDPAYIALYGEYRSLTYPEIKQCCTPVQCEYYAVIDRESSFTAGINAHDMFVQSGGSIYGGPKVYNPKGLSMDFSY